MATAPPLAYKYGKNYQGLSQSEVEIKIKKYGYNRLPTEKKLSFLQIVINVLKEPMLLLLLACGSLYFLLGDKKEALLLLTFVFVIITITILQERKNEKALAALRELSIPKTMVIRDGLEQKISSDLLVPGDTIIVHEGDRVPADAQLVKAENLMADESLLSGESSPVIKNLKETNNDLIFAGTMIVTGRGIAIVNKTGFDTELGKIGQSLKNIEIIESNLQVQSKDIIRKFSLIALFLCLFIVVVFGLTQGPWIKGLLAGLSLAMAILPEELPIVLTVFLAIGAWRIAQKQVLTKRMPAIETLGSITTLCTDKTGTLTSNRMEIKAMYTNQTITPILYEKQNLNNDLQKLLMIGFLSSPKESFDPMEKAIKEMSYQSLNKESLFEQEWELKKEYPLDSSLMAMSQAWWDDVNKIFHIFCKGAPEAVMGLCQLNEEEKNTIKQAIENMAKDGLRVIGLASSQQSKALSKNHKNIKFEFAGLIGLMDPIRPEVPQAIKECYQAGINVIMITGDHPITAQVIAEKIGLRNKQYVITGPELDLLTDNELKKRIKKNFIFARIKPEQKLRLVRALQANKEIIGMTGDGVNDAPALKAADIGIAMGKRGTEVARAASSLVLMDDNFASIVATIKEGRRIYENLKKASTYILAVHIPIAGLAIIPVLLQWPLILLPVHIVTLEVLIDPICTIVFEKEPADNNIMSKTPRPINDKLFNLTMLGKGLLLGLSTLLAAILIYYFAQKSGMHMDSARALAFCVLVLGNLATLLELRSGKRFFLLDLWERYNNMIYIVIVLASIALILMNTLSSWQSMFAFSDMEQTWVSMAILLGFLPIIIGELSKIPVWLKKI